jgi:hypothetical protein
MARSALPVFSGRSYVGCGDKSENLKDGSMKGLVWHKKAIKLSLCVDLAVSLK